MKRFLTLIIIIFTLNLNCFALPHTNYSSNLKEGTASDFYSEKSMNLILSVGMLAMGITGVSMKNKTDYEWGASSLLFLVGGYSTLFEVFTLRF
jgi:hypothetical protein